MVRPTPITQKTLTINARVNETGGPLGQARVTQNIAGELRQKRDQYQQQAIENAYLKGQTMLTKDLERIENDYASDPDGLSEALEEYSSSFLSEVSDPNMNAQFELQLTKAGQSAIARATAKRKTIINEQARFDNLQAFEAIKTRMPSIAQGLLSNDDGVALASSQELQEILSRGQSIMSASDADGVPLFNAAFRVNQLTDIKDTALQSATESWLDAQPDKTQALKDFENGNLSISLPDGQGGFESINVRDSVSPQMRNLIKSAAKAQIAEQKAFISQQRNIATSQIELSIETVQDDYAPDPNVVGPQQPGLSKAQKLGVILQHIDSNPLYSDTPDGIIKGNDLRKKVFAKLQKEQENYELITAGSAFASGQSFLNRQDTKAVQAYDKYYEQIEPGLSNLEPFERNMALTSIVDNAKAVPSRLTGDIQRIARSNDIEQITMAADLIDRIGAKNPHLIGDIAPQKDLARIQMINERISQGYTEEDAIKKVDDLLDPRNEITIGEATAELKAKKINYRKHALNVFDSFIGPGLGIDTTGGGQEQIIDGLSGTYRKVFEDHYRITRNEKLSHDYAELFVKGKYGITEVNGKKQVMPDNPEKYYGIENQDTKWMREQMLDAAQEATKGWLKSSPEKYGRADLKKNLVLLPHPFITPRTAEQGAPRYQLMYKNDFGELIPVSDKPFYFDPDQQRKKIVQDVAKQKEVEQQYGRQSLAKKLFEDRKVLENQQNIKFSQSRKEKIDALNEQLKQMGVE